MEEVYLHKETDHFENLTAEQMGFAVNQIKDVVRNVSVQAKNLALDLEEILSKEQLFPLSNKPIFTSEDLYKMTTKRQGKVVAKIYDGMLFLKMPLLLIRSRIYKSGYGRTECRYYNTDIKMALHEIKNDFKMSSEYAYQYIHVTDTSGAKQMADNDNYDTKYITDTVAHTLRTGDDCETVSFYFDTRFSDEIEEGTYLIVSSGKENIIPWERKRILLSSLF